MSQNKFVAFGDSWQVKLIGDFATGGGIGSALFGEIMGVDYVNVSKAGDSTEQLCGLDMINKFKAVLSPATKIIQITGGGDDFAGSYFRMVINPNDGSNDITKAVNIDSLNKNLAVTMLDYAEIVAVRDSLAPNALIVTSSYDFPPATMMGEGVEVAGLTLIGPWLQPGLIDRGWKTVIEQAAIVKIVLEVYNKAMSDFALLQRNYLHVNTQGTVSAEDFANELHLTHAGCVKIAQKINLAMLPWMDKLAKEI